MDKTDGVEASEELLGKRLGRARKTAGLTQQALCHKAHLSYSTLAKIERGAIKSPSIFTIRQIASALNVSLDELVGLLKNNDSNTVKKRSKDGISFIYFDINGCLVRFFQRAFIQLAEDNNISADIVEMAFWHYNDAVCKGEISQETFNKLFAKRLKVPKIDWQDYYLEAIDPIPEMQELLQWAVRQYRVGLLSNIMPGYVDILKKRGLIPDINYSVVVDSSQVKAIKPERKIYEIAEQMSHCLPSEILLVDDSRPNIVTAEHMGWHVLWFDDYRPIESVKRIRAALEPAEKT